MNNKLLVRRNIVGYYMLIPATILFLLINAFPLVYGLILSLTDKNYTKPKSGKFVGLENFKSIFHDSEFWSIMGYTIVYTVFVVAFSYLLGLALAVLLNKHKIQEVPSISVIPPGLYQMLWQHKTGAGCLMTS